MPVRGGSLAAFLLGDPNPAAPLVVAAHGITSNSHGWTRVARALRGRARLLALDLRGRGESRALPGPFGIAAHAADMVAVLDHLREERAVLAGHSMGAYIVARLAVEHPTRLADAVLVDGGLPLPGAEDADGQDFLDAFLGPSIERLGMRFDSTESYVRFWREHPAFAGPDVEDRDLAAFAGHDLVGEPPGLRSSVLEEAVRADGADLLERTHAESMGTRAILLRAPRGLRDGPDPMVPAEAAASWAAEAPERREVVDVPDVNHYTIVMGPGAETVAAVISERISAAETG